MRYEFATLDDCPDRLICWDEDSEYGVDGDTLRELVNGSWVRLPDDTPSGLVMKADMLSESEAKKRFKFLYLPKI